MEKFFSIGCQQKNTQTVIEDCTKQLEAAPEGYNFGFDL